MNQCESLLTILGLSTVLERCFAVERGQKHKLAPNITPNQHMGVSKNRGKIPKSSILIGFSIINHPFWGTIIFWKHPHMKTKSMQLPWHQRGTPCHAFHLADGAVQGLHQIHVQCRSNSFMHAHDVGFMLIKIFTARFAVMLDTMLN